MKARALAIYGAVFLAAVALDQWIKFLVVGGMEMYQRIEVLPFLALYRTANTGISFSLLEGLGGAGLTAMILVVIGFIAWLAFRSLPGQYFARTGFALVIGGAVGNLIDRMVHGHVVDYVLFHLPSWSFAVFNLADACISVGAALIVLQEIIDWRRGANKA